MGLLAVDYALMPVVFPRMFAFRLYFFDSAVLLGPLLFGAFWKHSVCDLWA